MDSLTAASALHVRDFVAFLARDPNRKRRVGLPEDPSDCPLVRWLRAEQGYPDAEVASGWWWPEGIDCDEQGCLLPPELAAFERAARDYCAVSGRAWITAGQALNLLEEVGP